MKLLKRISCLGLIFCWLMTFTGYASDIEWEEVPGNYGHSELLSESETLSRDEYHTVARGDFLAGAVTQIVNEQNGSMTISIDTYAHHDVDKIFHTVFLDVWKDDTESWSQIEMWDFSQTKEETEDGTISQLNTSFTLYGYETNKYYRVRGLHGVKYLGDTEACATRTNGVLITDGPT